MLLFICSHKRKVRQQLQECRKNNIMKEEYSLFVAEVRKWIEAGGDRKQAVDDAVDVCIEQGILRDILIRERTAIVNMVLSCTKKQYERLVEKELEQQEKLLRVGEKKMEEQERLLELNRKLVSEKEYALLEQIQNDPELTQKLLSQYGI